LTSSLGYFAFDNVATEQSVTLQASSKRYRFNSVTQQVSGDITGVELTGIE
jgi:hypothetical protein